MSRVRLYPYKSGSASAKALGILRLKKEGSRFRARPSDAVINWGASTMPNYSCIVYNEPEHVRLASDKVACLSILQEADHPVVPHTTHIQHANEWLRTGSKVYCRTLTRAHSGRGIVIAESTDQLVAAPLYTKYIKRSNEFRVHVIFGEVVDVQRKMRRRDVPDDQVNWAIRNHANGFIYGRGDVYLGPDLLSACVVAIADLGLDFGAVDLIQEHESGNFYILEVNTAPGLTGTTLEKYKEAFASC